MAKQRPTLGTFASPTSQLVAPIQQQAAPLNEQAIRDAYAFADSFSELSSTVGQFAITLKKEYNQEQVRIGQDLVNSNRKTYADLVKSGEIDPSENPWMAVGAQVASGVLEASRSRAEFQQEYDRRITENPELLKDNQFFDALAASYAQNKKAQFGTTQYLSDSFFDSFNPYLMSMGMKHAENIVKYRQGKIIQSLRVKVDEVLQDLTTDRGFGQRRDGSAKDVGWEGVMYDLEGNAVTEKSASISFDDIGTVDIPMIVPGLSVATKEKIVYENATLDDLSPEDQQTIINHAIDQLKQGRTPFFDTEDRLDKLIPDIQMFMDEMGANMGMPRTANLATAAHLVEAMKAGGTTYLAEEILSKLQGGTGLVKDTEEVKVMLADAAPDVSKVRFDLQYQKEKTQAALMIESAFRQSFSSEGEIGYEQAYDNLEQLLLRSSTISVEERGKIIDQFNEKWNNAAREGRESVDRNDLKLIRRFFGESMDKFAKESGSSVLNWQGLRLQFDGNLRSFDIDPFGEKAKNALRNVHETINSKLATLQQNFVDEIAGNASRYGLSANDPRLGTLNPVKDDPASLAADKENRRRILKVNEMMAGVHFGMEDRLTGIRSIATSGLSIDVERGVRPELADLIYIYRTGRGGQIPMEQVFGSGPAGKRMQQFLVDVSLKMDTGMSLDDSVRDSAQQLNMLTASNAKDLINFEVGSTEMNSINDYLAEIINDAVDSIVPFSYWDDPINPDSVTAVNSMFARKYFEALNQNGGAHEAALEAADTFVRSGTFFIRQSFVPKAEFDAANVGSEYIANWIDMEARENVKDAALVLVGYGGNSQAVFALRTPDGNAVTDRYYTAADITNNSRPRDQDGNIIEGALSVRERVYQRMGSDKATKRLDIENMRRQGLRELRGKLKQ